jgi:hypothetical protein
LADNFAPVEWQRSLDCAGQLLAADSSVSPQSQQPLPSSRNSENMMREPMNMPSMNGKFGASVSGKKMLHTIDPKKSW